jgi:hypothetical protein
MKADTKITDDTNPNLEDVMNSAIPEICLFGVDRIGFGWLASSRGRLIGDDQTHEPTLDRTLDDCIAEASAALIEAGETGLAWVFAPGGTLRALTTVESPRAFSDLAFDKAPVLVLDLLTGDVSEADRFVGADGIEAR